MDTAKRDELLKKITDSVRELGWGLATPPTDSTDWRPGLLIGTDEFVNGIVDQQYTRLCIIPADKFIARDFTNLRTVVNMKMLTPGPIRKSKRKKKIKNGK